MRADRADVQRLIDRDPTLAAQMIDTWPHLVLATHNLDAIGLLVEMGYDLNPTDCRTPLHDAAFHGRLALVQALVALGADPTIRDPDHDSTPQGWADYAGHDDVAHYLANLTANR